MTAQQREWLVKDFAREAFVRKGFAVDIAIHAPDKESDQRNHHAHLMVTRRTLGADGFAATKEWNGIRGSSAEWREQWANLVNRHLERHGHEARIDHRSLKEQGIDREAGVHLGYAANEMAQRGAQSDRMDALKGVIARNDIRLEMKQLDGELRALEDESRKPAPENPLDWTERAGMTAQQGSALRAFQARVGGPGSRRAHVRGGGDTYAHHEQTKARLDHAATGGRKKPRPRRTSCRRCSRHP